jgi:hypothetical protein
MRERLRMTAISGRIRIDGGLVYHMCGLESVACKTPIYEWEDCLVSFKCPRCLASNIADTQNGWEKCECGLMYSLQTKFYFKETFSDAV